ncbi:MAG TPA: rod shape-determining protein MreD [Firmicutes bacterium]|nr:rod shape-determining protein MreD [Bacillota bacterium]
MEGRYRFIRYFAYALELLVLYMIQQTPGFLPSLFGARPILIIPAVLAIAMFEPEIPAMAFGIFGGLLIDFGIGDALGFHGIMLGVACYVISALSANLLRTNLLTSFLVNTVSLLVIVVLQWLFYYVLYGYDYILYALLHHYLPRIAYSLVLTPITFYFNRAFALLIRPAD